MKMNNNYPMRIYFDENGEDWVIEYPDLPGCIGVGKSVEEALASGERAKTLWLKATQDMNESIPEPSTTYSMEYSGKFNLRIPKSLHRELSIQADEEGTSLNSFCAILLTKGLAKEYKTVYVCTQTNQAKIAEP